MSNFKIVLKTTVRVRGCPKAALEAVDFRRQHGLPERFDDLVDLDAALDDEALFRELVAAGYSICTYTDGSAEIAAVDNRTGFPYNDARERRHGNLNGYKASVPPADIRALDYRRILLEIARDTAGVTEARAELDARRFSLEKQLQEVHAAIAALP